DHGGEFLCELLDRAEHETRRLWVALDDELVHRLFADVLARLFAERVFVDLPDALAPIVENLAERAVAGAVAEKPFAVAQFLVVGVDIDGGQLGCGMPAEERRLGLL